MATFSSSVVPSAEVTWKSQDLPNMVTTGGPASTRAWRFGSSCGRNPGRRVAAEAGALAVASAEAPRGAPRRLPDGRRRLAEGLADRQQALPSEDQLPGSLGARA